MAALRLADFYSSRGEQVRYLALDRSDRVIHPAWDHRVRSKKNLARVARSCNLFIHFGCNPRLLQQLPDCARCRHVFVPCWYETDQESLSYMDSLQAERVSPCVAHYHTLRHSGGCTLCPWSSNTPIVRRLGPLQPGCVKACLYCTSASMDRYADELIELADSLLQALPQLFLTVYSLKTWSRRHRHLLRKWSRSSPRLTVRHAGSMPEGVAVFQEHDWLLFPAVRSANAYSAVQALTCGACAIGWDIAPFNEAVLDQHNGVLVPAQAVGMGPAIFDRASFQEVCVRSLADQSLLASLQAKDWRLQEARTAFESFWASAIEGSSR